VIDASWLKNGRRGPIFSRAERQSSSAISQVVRVGCREFECIGDKPPQDHPHIYLNMGDTGEIVCPYCATLFRFDPRLRAHESDPPDCAYSDMD
jgi:uncharacterized Zn-finger protein